MRELTIKVVVNDSGDGTMVKSFVRTPDGHYTISFDTKEAADHNLNPMIVLAHELGHVLGLEFGLPAHKMVGETDSPFWAQLTGQFLRREHEAWDLAEEMFRTRRYCIKSYEHVPTSSFIDWSTKDNAQKFFEKDLKND